MTLKRKLAILKIVLINVIPIIGYFLFDWDMFELAVVYIIETFSLYIVFFINRNFINKESRYPFVFALLQLICMLPVILSFMYLYALIAYLATGGIGGAKYFHEVIFRRLDNMYIGYIILIVISFDIGNFILISRTKKNPPEKKIWYHIKRILLIHFFMLSILFLASFFPRQSVVLIFFIIGFKILLDHVVNNQKIMRKIWTKIERWN